MSTEVLADAVKPRSSETLQVTVMNPGFDPTALSIAVALFPVIDPALAE
jgi:hypothetical protein